MKKDVNSKEETKHFEYVQELRGLIELTVSDTNVDEMTENPWQVDSIQVRSIKRGVSDIDTLYYKLL